MLYELLPYSPKFDQLTRKDPDALYLLTGYIRVNNRTNYQIPFVMISTIFKYWNCIKITPLIKLLSNNYNFSHLATNYSIKKVQYKFVLFVNSVFSLQIYPFDGVYQFSQHSMKNTIEMKMIKTAFGTCWKAFKSDQNIVLRINVIRPQSRDGNKYKYALKISLLGGGLFEGEINIKLNALPHEEHQLEILLWEDVDIAQGHTIYEQKSKSSRKTKRILIIKA